MGSGDSFSSYRSVHEKSEKLFSKDPKIRMKAATARTGRVRHLRAHIGDEDIVIPHRAVQTIYDESLVKSKITKPSAGVKRVWVLLIDNSGSNRLVATKLKQDSGYLTAFLNSIDGTSEIATVYFSDHCDGERGLMQEIDFVKPDEQGDKIICSTLHHIHDACGGDAAEAIECVLWRACNIDFRDAEERHLILVSDVVAHGMGMSDDDGCPDQRDWRKSLEKVGETYTSFMVVGSGEDSETGDLQKQFITLGRVGLDLIDLSNIKRHDLRLGMVPNAILFLIARQVGKQSIELFLSSLYEKWLKEPLFGLESDEKAKKMVRRLAKFLEYPDPEVHELLRKVLMEDQ